MKYPTLLFDADDTLFDFPKASAYAFSSMCRLHGVPCNEETAQLYHEINCELWAAFDRGEADKDFVTLERYVRFFKALGIERDPAQANRDYLAALGEGVYPLPYAKEVCKTLRDWGHTLCLVTNAVASVQRSRLRSSGFETFFSHVFITDDAGACKPDKAYYDYVLAHLPGVSPASVLAIGDSLATDIRGANNAGLPCCWYNPKGLPRKEGLRVDYEIHDLRQLLSIAE